MLLLLPCFRFGCKSVHLLNYGVLVSKSRMFFEMLPNAVVNAVGDVMRFRGSDSGGIFSMIAEMPQVQTIMGATAKHGKTILQFAAQSGNKESFEAVLDAAKEAFSANKVSSVCALDGISNAASREGHGSIKRVEMMHCERLRCINCLNSDGGQADIDYIRCPLLLMARVQVKSMMMWSSRNKAGNILRSAASSGSRDTFNAALASLELVAPPAEVLAHILHR